MTIKPFINKTDISLYFHMKNHYKKLENVKSAIDTSRPQGFMKTCSTPPNSDRSWKTCSCDHDGRHSKDSLRIPNSSTIKKHNCLNNAQKNVSEETANFSSRPKTRRHPFEMPCKSQWKSRSQVMLTNRKNMSIQSSNTKLKKKRRASNINVNGQDVEREDMKTDNSVSDEVPNNETDRSNGDRKNVSNRSEKSEITSRTEEHEYLQFLLRITEDIILNNFYTSEDLERVFKNHVEANRDRLKLEKMEAQLNRLCKELKISYKSSEDLTNEECYSNFFVKNRHNVKCDQNLANCECTTKRVLIPNKEEKEHSTRSVEINTSRENWLDQLPSSSTILLNRHSLGRVTECTEPTDSIDTLNSSLKQMSVTTVSSFGNVTVLPCFEQSGESSPNKRNEATECVGTIDQAYNNKENSLLTEKEKKDCAQEEILFGKNKNVPSPRHTPKLIRSEKIEHIDVRDKITNSNGTCKESKIEGNLVENGKLKSVFTNDFMTNLNSTKDNATNTKELKFITSFTQYNHDDTVKSGKFVLNNSPKCTKDQSVQIKIAQVDKECNTDKPVEIGFIRDDYVLLNGPVYVLKSVLNTHENVIVKNSSKTRTEADEIIPEKLKNTPTVDYLYMNKALRDITENNFSKLINSDYDLTPQRDDNAPEKYHHLLTDATTSFTNFNTDTVAITNFSSKSLLLSEEYKLVNKEIEVILPETRELVSSHESIENCEHENKYVLSTSESSSDGHYEIKSYIMPKEVNGSVRLSGYSIDSNSAGELDISLSRYEIQSDVRSNHNDSVRQETGKLRDLVEVGDGVEVPEEDSELSSNRLEKLHNSSSSTSSAGTYTKNILGKRKLNLPS